jgi:tetratricopeptide (TPR) repeat protein
VAHSPGEPHFFAGIANHQPACPFTKWYCALRFAYIALGSKTTAMKKQSRLYCVVISLFLYSSSCFSQFNLTTLPSGGNKKAMVAERVGLTDITIRYDRPAVKGRDGKIWGQLVPAGFVDQGFGNSKGSPWRAGSNENTTMEFSTDVTIEGKPLKAGKYGFFIAYDSVSPTIIFSTNNSSWGSYYYNAAEDALRVQVKAVPTAAKTEWLKYEFLDETENSATIALMWEKLMIPFKVEVDYVKDQMASFRKELRSERGFNWLAWDQAARWALQRNTNLEEALSWTDSSTSRTFGGNSQFAPWTTRAQILAKLNRGAEADAVMKKALPVASMNDLHQYGRQLLAQKRIDEALEIFKMNYSKNPNEFTTMMGLARGYSAAGDYKNALKYAKLALPVSPNANNTTFIKEAIQKLEQGKDIN